MRYFQDVILLLLYCLFSIQYTEIDLYVVLGFLLTLILSCTSFYLPYGTRTISLALCILYLGASWFIPVFLFYLPVIAYILLKNHDTIPALCGIILYVYRINGIPWENPSIFPLLFGLFGFLLSSLLQKYTEHFEQLDFEFRRTQDDSRERNLLLSEKNKSLQEKQDYEIYTATLKERNRIAREIHDNVGHVLSRSILLLGAVKTVNKENSLNPLLDNLEQSLNQAMDSIRSSVHDLHDESVNLKEAVQGMMKDFTFCPARLQYDMTPEVPKEVKYCFISITKEALSNIIKHSNASQVQITMREHPAIYQLCIEDNGNRFSGGHSSGIGLVNMKDRVRALNGIFQVTANPGFRIFITIPK